MGYPVGKSIMKMNRNLAQRKSLVKVKEKSLKRRTLHLSRIYLNEKAFKKA